MVRGRRKDNSVHERKPTITLANVFYFLIIFFIEKKRKLCATIWDFTYTLYTQNQLGQLKESYCFI